MLNREKKVEIRSLNKNKFGGLAIYPNSTGVVLVPQLTKAGFRTGLTKDEEKEFEKALNLKEGELSKKSEFWGEKIDIRVKTKTTLDLSDDWDFLRYKFACAHTRICPSPLDLAKHSDADFVIYDEESQAKVESASINWEIKAFEAFVKLSEQEKKDILKLYGTKTEGANLDIVNTRLHKFLKADPERFVKTVEDKDLEIKVFIEDLLDKAIIKKNKSFFMNGDDTIASSTEELVEYLKHPKNSAILASFKGRLETRKKK